MKYVIKSDKTNFGYQQDNFEFPYFLWTLYMATGMILGLRPANERWHYFVMTSLIGWVQA